MSRQILNIVLYQNISIDFQLLVGFRQFIFDFRVKVYATSANSQNLSIPQITSVLYRSRYVASIAKVVDILEKIRVQIIS